MNNFLHLKKSNVLFFSNLSILYKMRFFTFLCFWGLAAIATAQNYFYKWENANTLRLTPSRCPILDIEISQNTAVEVRYEEFSWIDMQAKFIPCDNDYSPAQHQRFVIKQGDKEMKIYGFVSWLNKIRALTYNGQKFLAQIPSLKFESGEFILNEETAQFARISNRTGQNFQRETNHFLQHKQSFGQDFVALLHFYSTQNSQFQNIASKCYFRHYPLDENTPFVLRQGENLSYGFFSERYFNYSFGQMEDKTQFWRDLLNKKQSFDLAKESQLAVADFSKMNSNFLNYLVPIDAVAVENEELIGRIWDYKGNFFLIQSSKDWREWKTIYTQTLAQSPTSRLKIINKNEILISLTDNFLYGKLKAGKWNFELINLDLPKPIDEKYEILDFEWANKNDIRAVIQREKNGIKTPEVEIIQHTEAGSKVILAGLSDFKSICYQAKTNNWTYACSHFIIQQKQNKTAYYPIANQSTAYCLENEFAECFYLQSRIQSYDSLKKIFPSNQIQYILSQTYPSVSNNLLAAAYIDTAGHLYAVTGDKQDKIVRLEIRDDEYRAKDEFIFLQLLSNNGKRIANATVKIGQNIWKDTLLWDENSRKMQPAYYINIRKNQNSGQKTSGNGYFNFKIYQPADMEISHPDYRTASLLNTDISLLNWSVLLTTPDYNFSEYKLTPNYSPIRTLLLYEKEQAVSYNMGKMQAVNKFIDNEILLVISAQQRPLRPALLAQIKKLNLTIDTSDFAPKKNDNEWIRNRIQCASLQYIVRLKKADNSNFELGDCKELAVFRDTALGVYQAGMRINLASYNLQNLEISNLEIREPNNNQIFIIDYKANAEQWEKRIKAAQNLGFRLEVQQSTHILILSGANSWTFRKLLAQSEGLMKTDLFKNSSLHINMAIVEQNCWD